jgi:hypothetical protein
MTTLMGYNRPLNDWLGESTTPRRERLEGGVLSVLRAAGTRSELREHVLELVDYLRMCGFTQEDTSDTMRELVRRAAPYMAHGEDAAVGDTPTDRVHMMLRWTVTRYRRAD